MLAIVEIGLIIWAWRRGWKAWALLPFSLAIIAFILGLAGVITTTNLWMAVFGDLAIIAVLSWMVAKPRRQKQLAFTGESSLSNMPVFSEPVKMPVVPVAREQFSKPVNNPVAQVEAEQFGRPANIPLVEVKEKCSKPEIIESCSVIQPPTVVFSIKKAALIMPDNTEIPLSEPVRPVGRSDFDKVVSLDSLKYISRNHFLVRSDNGKYYVEDLNSINGTKTNGIEIRGEKYELKNGDRIEIAGVAALTFKVA